MVDNFHIINVILLYYSPLQGEKIEIHYMAVTLKYI